MSMTERDRRTLWIGGTVLALLLGCYLLVLPMLGQWRTARQEIQEAQVQLQLLAAPLSQAVQQERRLSSYFGDAANKPLPTVSDLDGFIVTVESVLSAGRVKAQRIRPLATTAIRELPGVSRVAVQVEAEAIEADALAQCLAELQKAEPMILVERVTATAVSGGQGKLNVALVLATLARTEAE